MKAVFAEKIDAEAKKGKGGKKGGNEEGDEAMEEAQEESKAPATDAQKHKKFSQSLQPEEYQRLVQFFANELPKLALKLCNVKEFPSVDKLV